MTFRYRYTQAVPTVFIAEVKDGHTWVPDYLDEIEVDHPINHPSLELIVDDDASVIEVAKPIVEPPAENDVATEQEDAATGETEES